MRKVYLFEDYYDIDQTATINGEFSIPLGVSENGGLEEFHITEENRGPLLVSGRCGSGKSNYLHSLLNSIFLRYSSDQVNVWLYEYAKFEYGVIMNSSIPHVTGKWIGSENNTTEDFIASLEREIEERTKMFIENGCSHYEQYLRNIGNDYLPRVLVVIEDFDMLINELFRADYSYKSRFDSIIRMAHAFGITLVFSVQDALRCGYVVANALSKHIAMRQSDESIKAQFNSADAVELANSLIIGEAIIDIPAVHKVNLLYITPDIEKKIIAQNNAK